MELQPNKPLVSIGMPAYNGEQYIRKALDSLLAQDYENFELIISDNASTDSTLQICRAYAARDNRISIHVHTHNVGGLANFKTVLEQASGKYFMWAAVDDCWLPDFIEVLVKELEAHPEAGVAMCAVDRVWENGDLFDTIRFINKDNSNHRSYYQMLKSLTSGKKYNLYIYGLFRTQLLKEAISSILDVPRWDRLFICEMALATRFRYVDRVLHIRMHHDQPPNVRRPEEASSKMQNEDKWVNAKTLVALGQMLFQSNVIPWHRKFYLPAALWRYGWLLLIPPRFATLKSHCPPSVWNQLRRVWRWLLPE